jgi:hypothetical protein
MQWDAVMTALSDTLLADEDLVAALGGPHVYDAQSSRPSRVPSVETSMNGDLESEVFNPIAVQFDFWARGRPTIAAIESRLRLLCQDVAQELDGIPCSIRYVDATDIAYPADPGVLHRAVQIEIEVIRQPYAPLAEES